MLNYAIVLSAGSGKSTLSQKYEFLIDIDALHTPEFREELRRQYDKALNTGNWEDYNNFECNWILPKLRQFPEHYILLVHCSEKADILKLNILGAFKPNKKVIDEVIKNRDEYRGKLTKLNWETAIESKIMDSHLLIEKEVINIYRKIKDKEIMNNILYKLN